MTITFCWHIRRLINFDNNILIRLYWISFFIFIYYFHIYLIVININFQSKKKLLKIPWYNFRCFGGCQFCWERKIAMSILLKITNDNFVFHNNIGIFWMENKNNQTKIWNYVKNSKTVTVKTLKIKWYLELKIHHWFFLEEHVYYVWASLQQSRPSVVLYNTLQALSWNWPICGPKNIKKRRLTTKH